MGLFETKKKRVGDEFGPAVPVNNDAAVAVSSAAVAPAASASRSQESLEFGVDKAIELMRKLPDDNVQLVVQVVKTTLESIRVKVSSIIEDAERKEARLEDQVFNLKREITDLEQEIVRRRTQIAELEADHAETKKVKERLQLAEYGTVMEDLQPIESEPVATTA